jgi:predicted peptidase
MNPRNCNSGFALTLAISFGILVNCASGRRNVTRNLAHQTSSPAHVKLQTTSFLEKGVTNAQGDRMRYLLFLPRPYENKVAYPLVLWLHGGGSRGDDLKQLLAHGDRHGIGYLARSDNQLRYPAIIVAPQCPRNKLWASANGAQPTTEIKLVLEILDRVQAEYNVDKRRLYVMGMSLGGYGTWGIIAIRPGMFAAAVPICGGGETAKAVLMKNTSIWAFHGDEDELVDVSESRRMIAALKHVGGNPRYTEYKGVGHNAWERAFAEPDLLPWMFAQRAAKQP